jgi:uncharacterized protein with HEPN domain
MADCLSDIVENAERIAAYIAGLDDVSFERNELVRDAVESCVERVREAVHRLGTRAEMLMPGQPWADIRGMGNRLRHAYRQISTDIMWHTAMSRVPELADAARDALTRLEGETNAPG